MRKRNVTKVMSSVMLTACLMMSNFAASTVIAANENYPADIRTFDKIEEVYGKDYSDKIVILSSNDTHGNVDDFAYMKPLEKYFTDMHATVLTVDCGDFSQNGKKENIVDKTEGIAALKIMETAGYDVVAMGNHEFDYIYEDEDGCNLFRERMENGNFDKICANLLDNNKNQIINHNCVKTVTTSKDKTVNIGFFGLDTGETTEKNHASFTYTDGVLNALTGSDMVACAENEINDLRNIAPEGYEDPDPNETADIVICLAHLGVEEGRLHKDSSILLYNGDEDEDGPYNGIGENVDLILDANSHTVMTSGNNGEPIMSTGEKFANIGVVIIDAKNEENAKPSIIDRFLISSKEFKGKFDPDGATQDTIKLANKGEFNSLVPEFHDKDGKVIEDPYKYLKDKKNNENKNGNGGDNKKNDKNDKNNKNKKNDKKGKNH